MTTTRPLGSANRRRFVDYFVVCGLDHDDTQAGLDSDPILGDYTSKWPLDRPFKPTILTRYPTDAESSFSFDPDAVRMLCLPRGVHFAKTPAPPSFHSFLITREDGSRLYGAALTTRELVETENVILALETLQAMHVQETGEKPGSRAFDRTRERLYVTQCIALLSSLPFVWPHEQYLTSLYELSASNPDMTSLPIESYIHNLLYAVPLPPPGRSMQFFAPSGLITCTRPGRENLPLLDFPLRCLFEQFSVEKILLIYTCLLLEHQILFVADEYQLLMTTAESLTALMFPFTWQHVYVPILPKSLYDILDAPVPFVMGYLLIEDEPLPPVSGDVVFVDINKGEVRGPTADDFPELPNIVKLREKLQEILDEFRFESPETLSPKRKVLSPIKEEEMTAVRALNPQLQKMLKLAKKAGIETSVSHLLSSNEEEDKEEEFPLKETEEDEVENVPRKRQRDVNFNESIRDVFLRHVVQMFSHYEKFVILPKTDNYDDWLTGREHVENFDKAAFLSDQPERHLPFLSSFLETQAFASFIDTKIIAKWDGPDASISFFDSKINAEQRKRSSAVQSASEDLSSPDEPPARSSLLKRIDYHAKKPKKNPDIDAAILGKGEGPFRRLRPELLAPESGALGVASWNRAQRREQQMKHLLNPEKSGDNVQLARQRVGLAKSTPNKQPHTSFVLRLLKECRMKVKRLLVQKMGREAIILGHGDLRTKSLTGVEENTLVGSFCDLLERIWSHGLKGDRDGRSSLWSHILAYKAKGGAISPSRRFSAPQFSRFESFDATLKRLSIRTWSISSNSPEMRRKMDFLLSPRLASFCDDVDAVRTMPVVKTEVGFARAWIRLCLEKKILSGHMKELLSDEELLGERYKDYAFLQSEDEREQFLYHLLSLTTVNFFCFTQSFANTPILYRVNLVTGRSLTSSGSTANLWFLLAGQNGDSGVVALPKGDYDADVEKPNLGLLTSVRVGHDNSGLSPGIFIDAVVVRNMITDAVWKFPCGRWLSRGEDDGSVERLLVGELCRSPPGGGAGDVITPPRRHSPKPIRRDAAAIREDSREQAEEILQATADAVNRLVKYYGDRDSQVSLPFLLCGDGGLCAVLHDAFAYNFRASRLFRSNMLPWDFVQRAYESLVKAGGGGGEIESFLSTVQRILEAPKTIGKDGKFQAFVCLGARDHALSDWLFVLMNCSVVETLYEPDSFFRQRDLMKPLRTTLSALNGLNIRLDPSLLKGIAY
ncbi:DENN domain-containing protein 5A-like [Oscarella lobularis]|uniref:DENN domain-containing protein 5A-like n=1 Tax=Oscarella lobularis TaxID=121494 RepID=UPI00331365CF